MKAQSAEGTVEAEQSASSQSQEQPEAKRQELVSISDALIKAAKESGHDVGELKESETPPEPPVAEPTETEAVTATEEQPELLAEGETAPDQQEEEAKPPDPEKDDNWPVSAKKRVAEESEAKRRFRERAELAEGRIAQLEGAVAQLAGPRPTEAHPFADVYDAKALENYEREYREMRTTARMHRDGTDDEEIVIYKDKNGQDIKGRLTRESAAELEDKADNMLQSAIPKHRDFLRARVMADQEALKAYPEFQKPDSTFTQRAIQLISAYPDLATVIGPNLLQVVARYLKGEDLENSNGNGAAAPQNEVTRKIVQSAQQKVAPTPTKNTTFSERRTDVDLVSAKKRLEETGSIEDANALLRIKLAPHMGTAKKVARSGE